MVFPLNGELNEKVLARRNNWYFHRDDLKGMVAQLKVPLAVFLGAGWLFI